MNFAAFANDNGLVVDAIVADGRVHRVKTEDHPRKLNGAYLFDGLSGWVQNWALHEKPLVFRDATSSPVAQRRHQEEARRIFQKARAAQARREAMARTEAREVLARATIDRHPYLYSKGFPEATGYVEGGALIIPMWEIGAYGKVLNSIQRIHRDGTKKFLFGGKAAGSVYRLGSGRERWFCEGYATGLSVHAALKRLYRSAAVTVCFSAGNLMRVARNGVVVADHDASGAGERAAKGSGCRYWMPREVDTDANDFHQRFGLTALVLQIRELRSA